MYKIQEEIIFKLKFQACNLGMELGVSIYHPQKTRQSLLTFIVKLKIHPL